eukprot:CAMPEP_0183739062 /NCGR_PEP_ID=MMETSP0737-20130205/56128_1 /TAXON_ID=385413 /ORGANISM="Thalassiosira miniscula, Strain CCMP1093" /LENGTH=167 /DNA_ID=CAMNT_0025973751 /DNA_START=38 /DNA_END=540 /DNA_ORIENTATION=+
MVGLVVGLAGDDGREVSSGFEPKLVGSGVEPSTGLVVGPGVSIGFSVGAGLGVNAAGFFVGLVVVIVGSLHVASGMVNPLEGLDMHLVNDLLPLEVLAPFAILRALPLSLVVANLVAVFGALAVFNIFSLFATFYIMRLAFVDGWLFTLVALGLLLTLVALVMEITT